jgi:hypothetical protein
MSHGGALTPDSSVALGAVVVDGEKILSAPRMNFDLGTLYVCEDRDTVIPFVNTGCDTLSLRSLTFSNASFVTTATLPLSIAPQDTVWIPVHLSADTTGHPTGVTAQLNVTSTATNTLTPLNFTSTIRYPSSFVVRLTQPQHAKAGDQAVFTLTLEGSVPAEITSLRFDLAHNDDILSYDRASGTGLTMSGSTIVGGMMHQTYTLSPVPSPGTIGTLTFRTYLAKEPTTPLAITNLTFDNSVHVPNDCIASVSDSSSSFKYVYQCGEGVLQEYMRSGRISTGEAVYPNPVTVEAGYRANIPYLVTQGCTLELSVTDETGREVYRQAREVQSAGSGSFEFDGSLLASGRYYYIIRDITSGAIAKRSLLLVK